MAYLQAFPNQTWLLPPSLTELIPSDHICYLIEEFVNTLDFSKFDEYYDGAGRPAYPPRVPLKILIYGMLNKVRSSRQLAKECRENFVYIYLSEKVNPSHRSLRRFRKLNQILLKDVFKQTITFAAKHDLIDLHSIFIDGTFIKANAGRNSEIEREAFERLDRVIEKMISEDIELDKLEEELFGDREEHLTRRSRKNMRRLVRNFRDQDTKKVVEKVQRVREEFAKNPKQKSLSLTDTDCRILRNKKGPLEPLYNVQFSVDAKHQIIVANDVCQDYNDFQQLEPQVLNVEGTIGPLTKENKLGFDAGYSSASNCAFLEKKYEVSSAI